jgi:FdhE protein
MLNSNAARDRTEDQKIGVLRQIRKDMPHYNEILDFFLPIFKERKQYTDALASCPDIQVTDNPAYSMRHKNGLPFLTKDDVRVHAPIIKNYFLKLASIMKAQAFEKTERLDELIARGGEFRFQDLIGRDLNKAPYFADDEMIGFLINETLGPVLEIYARKLGHHIKPNAWQEGFCPVCGKKPEFAVLKAEDGKRLLICSVCGFKWDFKRIQCVYCGNEDQKLLSYLMAAHEDMYRIETCDACRRYLKTIDLKNAAHEIFYDIESMITLHLDMIARNHGYSNDRWLQAG